MIAKAAYLHLRARLRQWRGDVDSRFDEKLSVCEKCPLRSARGGVFYCGAPVWERLLPTATTAAGCGCPLHVKARDRESHCPLRFDGTALAHGSADVLARTTSGLGDATYGVSDHDVVKTSDGVVFEADGGECECKWCNTLRDNPNAPPRAVPLKTFARRTYLPAVSVLTRAASPNATARTGLDRPQRPRSNPKPAPCSPQHQPTAQRAPTLTNASRP